MEKSKIKTEEKTHFMRSVSSFCRKNRTSIKRCLLIALVLVLLVGVYFCGKHSNSNKDVRSKTVKYALRDIGELATQAGMFTNVQVIGDSREVFGIEVPFTGTKRVFSYDGDIKAGVDFAKIDVKANETDRVIHVTMPFPRILSIEIDENSCEIYDERKNMFNQLEISDFNDAIIALKEEARQNALDNGILENAQKNAEQLIRGMLSGQYDLSEYTLEFEWVEGGNKNE